MITMAVVGALVSLAYGGLRYINESTLRETTTQVAATLRTAYGLAALSGNHHRVVFDLQEQRYHIEMCEGPVMLRRSDEEQVPDDDDDGAASNPQAALAEALKPQPGVSAEFAPELAEAQTLEDAVKLVADLDGTRVGAASCAPTGERTLDAEGHEGVRTLPVNDGLRIRRMYVQHLEGEQRDGLVYVNFFPLGYAEKALIEIGDENGDSVYTLLVHALTGRIEFFTERVDADELLFRRADGEDVGDR